MARQLDRAYYLKRLFDEQLLRTSSEDSPETREQDAARLMDELVGPRWRSEVNAAGVALLPDIEEIPTAQEVEEFWGRVQQAGYDAGFGVEEVRHNEPQDEPEPHCGPPPQQKHHRILAILKILGLR